MPALAIWTPEDTVLGAMAPLGLAVAAGGPTLVIDLDPRGPRFFGAQTLAELVADGPRRSDLTPSQSGVAVLSNGGVTAAEAEDVVRHLVAGWPFAVLRLGDTATETGFRMVTVLSLLPDGIMPAGASGAAHRDTVYQDAGWRLPAPGPGLVLPPPRRSTWTSLARGLRPPPDRWLRALRPVWSWA